MKLFSAIQKLFHQNESLDISLSAASLKGTRHELNEDRIAINGSICRNNISSPLGNNSLITLFDGMSGESMGAQCAEAAASLTSLLYEQLRYANGYEDIRRSFDAYANSANAEIRRILDENKVSRGGSTFAAIYISGGKVYPFSLGDSRIYLLYNDILTRISSDHTIAARKLQYGMYTQEEADASPDSHRLTLFLGLDTKGCGITAESYAPIKLRKGMKLFICSDGVYDVCPDQELSVMLRSYNADKITETISAKSNGDDISASIITIN